jgi:rhamnogalacturonan endolyase
LQASYVIAGVENVETTNTLKWLSTTEGPSNVTIYRAVLDSQDATITQAAATIVAQLNTIDSIWVDSNLETNKHYYYWISIDDSANNVTITSDRQYVFIPLIKSTNLTSVKEGNAVRVTWNLKNFGDMKAIELYVNNRAQASGRTRLSASVQASGDFLHSNGVEGTRYWYMFKITMNDNTTVNTDPEGEIVY